MNQAELNGIVASHGKWLRGEPNGRRADLRGADLSGANLRCANLRCANLRCANLRDANLSGADLSGADLSGADLRSVNLRSVNLRDADLGDADLRDADLRDADLNGANLSGADLRDANLRGAYLSGADLSGAVRGQPLVVQSGPLGSRNGYLVTIWHPEWPAEQVTAGCWRGTLDKLTKRVARVYPYGRYRSEYDAAIAYHRAMLAAAKGEAGK